MIDITEIERAVEIFNWPAAVAVIAIFFLVLFRSEIKVLLGRVSHISKTGISVEPIDQTIGDAAHKGGLRDTSDARERISNQPLHHSDAGPKEESMNGAIDLSYASIMNLGPSMTRDDFEKKIRADLQSLSFTSDESINVLVRHLAHEKMRFYFLEVYGGIFGSQIKLLQDLNGSHGACMSELEVESFFERIKAGNNGVFDSWNLDTYLNFLLARQLIVVEADGQVLITHEGRDFLLWFVDSGKSLKSL